MPWVCFFSFVAKKQQKTIMTLMILWIKWFIQRAQQKAAAHIHAELAEDGRFELKRAELLKNITEV